MLHSRWGDVGEGLDFMAGLLKISITGMPHDGLVFIILVLFWETVAFYSDCFLLIVIERE